MMITVFDGSAGNGQPVPMNWSKRWLGQANIAYQFFKNVKINTELLYSKDNYQDFNGSTYGWKLEPGGNPFKYAESYDGTFT